MQETSHLHRKSFRTLRSGLDLLDSPPPLEAGGEQYQLTEKDKNRAIALSQKIGSLALSLSDQRNPGEPEWDGLAEKYLLRALEGMIGLGTSHLPKPTALPAGEPAQTRVVGRDFIFPDERPSSETGSAKEKQAEEDKGDREVSGHSIAKVTRKSMGLVMQGLGDLYARRGDYE